MLQLVLTGMVVFVITGAATFPGAEDMVISGEVVEVSCFAKNGVARGTGVDHVACAKECVANGQALGILTDGDGLIKVTGPLAADKYKKLVPFIGKTVEVRGVRDRYLDYSRAINASLVIPVSGRP